MKVIIVGGVAGGATAAARIRRLDEKAEIIIFEKGEYVSFANCGLPYHISGVIPKRESLILKRPKEFKLNYNIDVRTLSEVISIDTQNKKVEVRVRDSNDLTGSGKCYSESYDKLLLSPGASAFTPPFKNDDNVPFYVLKTIPDMDRIIQTINEKQIKHATILGGGFIGVEIAENLLAKGIETHIIELSDQVMAPFDFEMANILHKEMIDAGVNLHLNNAIESVHSNHQANHQHQSTIQLMLRDGAVLETQILISAVGVRPETAFIKDSRSIKLNERGAIIVDDFMQTSDPSVWAVGDAVQIKHIVDNTLTSLPLAGPANRQGRIAADNICHHQSARYRGVQGTSIIKVFGLTAASTGINEKYAQKNKIDYDTFYLHPNNHVTYYPGATQITFKIIYNPKTFTLLGAQAVGKGEDGSGVDKRMDVLATVLHAKIPLTELQDIEYTYAPPYGSAKDAINMIGFMASNIQLKLERFISPKHLESVVTERPRQIIDVRTKDEYALGHVKGAINIPLHEMREKIKDLSQFNLKREEETIVYCAVGVRSHNAFRILIQNGFTHLHNLSGGYKNYLNFFERYKNEQSSLPSSTSQNANPHPHIHSFGACHHQLDLSGMQCPGPIVALNTKLNEMKEGEEVMITVSDRGFLRDAKSYCENKGHTLIDQQSQKSQHPQNIIPANAYHLRIVKGTKNIIENKEVRENKKTIVVFSNELDRAMASFIIANGARAMGSEVTLFFTFWGLSLLKKEINSAQEQTPKTLMEKMFSWMLPKGTRGLSLSKMSMFGLGTVMMKKTMKQKNVLSLRELIDSARSSGVKLIACAMSMDVMGIKEHELIDGVEIAGVANYLAEAEKSNTNLFI